MRTAKKRIEYGEDPLVAAQNFETFAQTQGWKPKKIERKQRRILDTPVGIIPEEKYSYGKTLIEQAYQNFLNRAPTQSEVQQNLAFAGAKGINPGDRGAFESSIFERLLSSPEGMAKVKTPEDIEYERKYGPIPVVDGRLQRGMVVFRPDKVAGINKQLREAAFSPIASMSLSV